MKTKTLMTLKTKTSMRSSAALVSLLLVGTACRQVDPSPPPDPDTSGFHEHVVRAILQARQDVVDDDRSAERWGRLGMLFQAHELTVEAARCYDQAMRIDPTDYRWPYLSAVQHDFGALDPDERLRLLMRAHELNPHYSPLNVRIGDRMLDEGWLDEARLSYAAALAADPESSHALLGLARIAIEQGDPDGARAHLEEARWQDPGHREVHRMLARVYDTLGLDELARRAAYFARRSDETEFWDPLLDRVERESLGQDAMRRRVRQRVEMGDYEGALLELQVLRENEPPDATTHLLGGRVLFLLGRDAEALVELERAHAIDPTSVQPDEALLRLEAQRAFERGER